MSHKMRRLTVVAYAVNGSGLGHLTRVLALLRWMRRLALLAGVRLDVYVLTSSESPGLAFEEGFAVFKIPSKVAVREAGLPKDDYLRLARQWVWHSLGLLKPDLLLVDTFPGGSFGELVHALDVARARVFIQRAMREEFAASGAVRGLLPFYDRIIISTEPGSAPDESHPEVAERTCHVGPVMLRSREEMRPRAEARLRLGIPEGKLGVWLSAGGGGDALAASLLPELAEVLSEDSELHLVVGAGPLYKGRPVRSPRISWLTGFHAAEDFSGLDFAIAAAGYNSFYELLHSGVPTAFFAQEKIADEQWRRVRAAQESGCALAFDAGGRAGLDVQALKRVVTELKDEGRRAALTVKAREFVPTNDARDAAFEALTTLLPADELEDVLDLAAPHFFLELARHDVSLDDLQWTLRRLAAAEGLDAEERRVLIVRLLTESGVRGPASTRMFQAFAGRLAVPSTERAAQELVEAATQVARAAVDLRDEPAVLELLRAVPRQEGMAPRRLAAALSDFIEALSANDESPWRGKTILIRHLETADSADSTVAGIGRAAAELRRQASDDANITAPGGLTSGEKYDSTFGD
jgi:predicted glycosyltransferase